MSNYPNTTLTNAGQDLLAESLASGKALIFTKVELGDGNLATGQSISTLTALISPKMNVPLSSGSTDNGQAKLRFAVGNSGLEAGFFAREVGIFAKAGADGVETLYAYTNGGNYVDFIPDKSRPIDDQIMDVYIVTGNASDVQIQVDSAAYLTVEDMTDHDGSYESHKDIYGKFIRQQSTSYKEDDVVFLPGLGAKMYLECSTPGTTSAGPLEISIPTVGATITDGSVKWTIKKISYVYTLPAASASVLGGVKTGSNITNNNGTISLTKTDVINALGYTPPTVNTTYSNFVKSGSGAKAGLVPAPSTTAGTTKYLREDGTWQVPPDHTYSTFVKSGASAAAGLVPKPGTTAGTTHYLREDGTWQVPPNTTYGVVTSSANGLMTPAMLAKLGSGGITAASLAANGYVKFANGFIVQWGNVTKTSTGYSSITFPISFPTAAFSFVKSSISADGNAGDERYVASDTLSKTGVKTGHDRAGFFWIAIGH
ncbi:MAG: hypothetical protein E7202_06605 [Selenomonas ruminantium]|jgi:hypothetical protein|nr:hypothetical protein [Selenomonas ruminantium]